MSLPERQGFRQAPLEISFSLTNWSFEDVVVRDQCSFFIRQELIDFTVFEGATCEGELLREIVDKDFATGELTPSKRQNKIFERKSNVSLRKC